MLKSISPVVFAAAFAILMSTDVARAQVPAVGYHMRDCTTAGAPDLPTSRPMLFGFHWQSPSRSASPDVLFDERWWDPSIGWGPNLGLAQVDNPGWLLQPNWRLPQLADSTIDAVVIVEGELWLDSSSMADLFDCGLVNVQKIGSLGGDSPEVTTQDGHHRIRFQPLREIDDTHGVNECTPAGAAPRGFLRGYVVWSLPVAQYPTPTPNDFLVHGSRSLIDLASLDFTVPDADGTGGSDLDATDGVVLVNPDGAPDTGDEIVDFMTCSPGGESRWYSVQPVVRGSFSYYDGGVSGVQRRPGAVVDLNADGTPDVADILVDGYYEFSDGCIGLGLLWRDGIATSASPGLGATIVSPPACTPATGCDRGNRTQSAVPHEPSAIDLRNVIPFTVHRSSTLGPTLVVGWEETLGGKDALYIGDLNLLVQTRACDFSPANPCEIIGSPATIPQPPGAVYFVVVHQEGTAESSYGRDSFGRERLHASTPCP